MEFTDIPCLGNNTYFTYSSYGQLIISPKEITKKFLEELCYVPVGFVDVDGGTFGFFDKNEVDDSIIEHQVSEKGNLVKKGENNIGVMSNTAYGDGSYPVFINPKHQISVLVSVNI